MHNVFCDVIVCTTVSEYSQQAIDDVFTIGGKGGGSHEIPRTTISSVEVIQTYGALIGDGVSFLQKLEQSVWLVMLQLVEVMG